MMGSFLGMPQSQQGMFGADPLSTLRKIAGFSDRTGTYFVDHVAFLR